jgi:hypothetical protein
MKCLCWCLPILLGWTAVAEEPATLTQTAQLVRAGSVINLPGLTIHGGDKPFVEATGKPATTDGILEFVAVETGGRDYESLFTLDCRPSALKFALLLIGCEPGESNGTPLTVEVEWRGQRLPLERLLIDRSTHQSPAPLPWVFTGSYFIKSPVTNKEVFQSDEEQAHLALWWQPSIIINLRRDFGNPYRGEDQGFEANTKLMPPKNTPISLILRKRG